MTKARWSLCCAVGLAGSFVLGCDPSVFDALLAGAGRGGQDGGTGGALPPPDGAAGTSDAEAGMADPPDAGATMDAGKDGGVVDGGHDGGGGAPCGLQPACDPAVDGMRTRETGQPCGELYCNKGREIVTEVCMDDCTWQVSASECDVGDLCQPEDLGSQGFRCPMSGFWQWCFLSNYSREELRCTWSQDSSPCPEGCTCEPEDCHC